MTKANFRRTLVGAAVATALGVLATPAAAAPYRGTFDPVDFAGEYIVDVDPACLLQGAGWYANAGLCSATLTSAFANVVSSSPDPTFTGALNFAPPAISSDLTLFGIYVYGGKIDSFDTGLIHQVSPASPGGVDDWWIEFISGQMPDNCVECYGPAKGVYLYYGADPTSPAASAEYLGPAEAIPEPGTLSLVLGALGGGWLARRRRKRKDKVPDPN
jgi:hypothetical protein